MGVLINVPTGESELSEVSIARLRAQSGKGSYDACSPAALVWAFQRWWTWPPGCERRVAVLAQRASGRATSASAPTTFHFNLRGGVNSSQIVVAKKPEHLVDCSGFVAGPSGWIGSLVNRRTTTRLLLRVCRQGAMPHWPLDHLSVENRLSNEFIVSLARATWSMLFNTRQ